MTNQPPGNLRIPIQPPQQRPQESIPLLPSRRAQLRSRQKRLREKHPWKPPAQVIRIFLGIHLHRRREPADLRRHVGAEQHHGGAADQRPLRRCFLHECRSRAPVQPI